MFLKNTYSTILVISSSSFIIDADHSSFCIFRSLFFITLITALYVDSPCEVIHVCLARRVFFLRGVSWLLGLSFAHSIIVHFKNPLSTGTRFPSCSTRGLMAWLEIIWIFHGFDSDFAQTPHRYRAPLFPTAKPF